MLDAYPRVSLFHWAARIGRFVRLGRLTCYDMTMHLVDGTTAALFSTNHVTYSSFLEVLIATKGPRLWTWFCFSDDTTIEFLEKYLNKYSPKIATSVQHEQLSSFTGVIRFTIYLTKRIKNLTRGHLQKFEIKQSLLMLTLETVTSPHPLHWNNILTLPLSFYYLKQQCSFTDV